MLGMLFLSLGLVATKVTIWQMGFLSSILGAIQPDYTIAGFSLTAAIIFFALWLAGVVNKDKLKSKILFE